MIIETNDGKVKMTDEPEYTSEVNAILDDLAVAKLTEDQIRDVDFAARDHGPAWQPSTDLQVTLLTAVAASHGTIESGIVAPYSEAALGVCPLAAVLTESKAFQTMFKRLEEKAEVEHTIPLRALGESHAPSVFRRDINIV